MNAIETIVWFLATLLNGEYSIDDITYSVESFIRTGVVLEDSIFWCPDTMGNGIGYDRFGTWHN